MKTVTLQLVIVGLENGQQGVIHWHPLTTEGNSNTESQVEEIWFSSAQEVPEGLAIEKIMRLIAAPAMPM